MLVLVTTKLDIMIKNLFLITDRFYLLRLSDNISIMISFQFNLILMMNSMTNISISDWKYSSQDSSETFLNLSRI